MARMEIAALAVAAVALLVAWIALRRASGLSRAIEDAQADARRRAENLMTEVEQRLETDRKLLAEVAAGHKLDREQILEGRLWREIGAREAADLVARKAVRVLDVRTPQETALGVIAGAQIIPVEQLEQRQREVVKGGLPILVYCAAGARSAAACELLSAAGHEGLMNLSGGFQSWNGPRA